MSHKTASQLSYLLRSCIAPFAIYRVNQTHAQILIGGLLPNVTLQTDLLLAYAKCGFLHEAHNVFDKMTEKNMHSWNIMIASYVQNSMGPDAMNVFYEFRKTCLQVDHYTLPPMFKTCVEMRDNCLGLMLHALVIRLGLEEYVFVGNAILDFYVKCGSLAEARRVFHGMPWKDSTVWNSMISGLGKAGLYVDALNCFRNMLGKGREMDCMTIPSILNACREEGHLIKGKELHAQVVKSIIFKKDVAVSNSLIDMYAKCGCLSYSENVFSSMSELNLISWTTMISCYGFHGKGEEALVLYNKMIYYGLKPNSVTLTAVMASCCHSGLLEEARNVFKSISSDYGFEPSIEHYACMVDLLGRCGYVEEAFELVKNMKLAMTASVWGALLAGCLMHKNIKIGAIAAHRLFELEPKNCSNYIALCSIYDSLGLSCSSSLLRMRMKQLGLVKTPGCSWVTIGRTIHKFYQGDNCHPETPLIYETLNSMNVPTSIEIFVEPNYL